MKKILTIFLAIFIFFLAGCIQRAKPEIEYVKPVPIVVTPEKAIAYLYPCMTFECRNGSGPIGIGWIAKIFGKTYPLSGGECAFFTYPVTQRGLKELNDTIAGRKKGEWRVRTFMIGQGPNLATANEMQKYCNWSLGFGVHWLTKPEMPSEIKEAINRSLKYNTIPYIIIQTGQQIASVKGEPPVISIAKNLSDVGPVFVSPEGELGKDPKWLVEPWRSDYKYQIRGIAINCPKCIIVPLINFKDAAALSFLNETEIGGKYLIDYSSAIAYGIDLNKFNCSKYSVLDEIENFTSVIMGYKKPSLIAYIKGKPGPNEAGTCIWTEDEIAATYEYLFSQIPFLVPNGLIGMAQYGAVDLFDKDGNQRPTFKAWFSNCQTYMNQTDPELAPQVPLLFPLGGDVEISVCTHLNTQSMLLYVKCGINYSLVPEIAAHVDERTELKLYGDWCFDFTPPATTLALEPNCDRDFPAIRQFAADVEFDPSIAIGASWYPREKHCACGAYEGKIYDICCSIQTLSHLYNTTREFEGKRESGIDLRIYFTLFGHKYGDSALNDHTMAYKNWKADPAKYQFSFDPRVIETMQYIGLWREKCGLCKD